MRFLFKFLSFFTLTLFLGLFAAHTAFADTFTLSGSVKDSSGTAIIGATVTVNDANSDTTTTDSSGNYSLPVPSGTYNVQVTPPAGSGYSSAIALTQNISANTVLNFILTSAGTVMFQGHLTDPNGVGIPNQTVSLSGGTNPSTRTDSTGKYTLLVSPGTYYLEVYGNANNSPTFTGPTQYSIESANLSLTQDVTLNLTLPTKKVSVHVQDASGAAVSNVTLSTPNNQNIIQSNLSIGGGITNGKGPSTYITSTGYITTDSNGDGTMWLFPNSTGTASYIIVATPLTTSNYAGTTQSITVTGNTSQTIVLPPKFTVHGKLADPNGNGIPNQTVALSGGASPSTKTDSSGNYTLSAAQGSYYLEIFGNANNSPTFTGPTQYSIESANFSLTQDTTLNLTLPTKRVDIHVQNAAGVAVSNVTLTTPNSQSIIQSNLSIGGGITNGKGPSTYITSTGYVKTDTGGNATLWLFPNSTGTAAYTIVATPAVGSTYTANTLSLNVTDNSSQTIVVPGSYTISGKLTDPNGNGIPNQTVYLSGNNVNPSVVTDSAGNYSLTATNGTYYLGFYGNANNSPTFTGPTQYTVESANFSLIQNTTLNLTIPTKKVNIHVQDATGAPVSNVTLSTPNNQSITQSNLSIGSGITNATGPSTYVTSTGYLKTDSSGNATMWLFPNSPGTATYTIIASPQVGSNYIQYSLNNITITSDPVQNELVSLQYNHATPVTTANLTTQRGDGTYTDPTTVSLSATAAATYTVANTYYTIDGGSPTVYTTPFTVTGNGNHTITYWSVDNSGVQEAHHSQSFTIVTTHNVTGTVFVDSDQNGVQNGENGYAGAVLTLNNNQTVTTDANGNYSFANLPADTYVETLTLPNGYTATTTNPATVALNADTTQNFGIVSGPTLVTAINTGGNAVGSFASDTNFTGGSQYSTSTSADTSGVTNPAPQSVYQSVRYGNFTYSLSSLTPNTTYTVRLHFNELYWNSAGQRVFNVSANGQQVLGNFDIFQAAGGANKAVVEDVPATSDANGNVALQFSTVTDNAMVNGIEVYSGSLPTPTPTSTPGCQNQEGCFTVDSLTYNHSTHNLTMHITSLNPSVDVSEITHASINRTVSEAGNYWGKSGSCNSSGYCTFVTDLNNGGTYSGIPGDSVWFFVDNVGSNPYHAYGSSKTFYLDSNSDLNYDSSSVNAGGGASGNFAEDSGFNGGSTYTTTNSVDTSSVTNPAPQNVYQSVRYGNFSYTMANLTPNTNYLVKLHFNELYWTSAGQRVFNVSINGSQVLGNFDVYQAAGGANKAMVEQFVKPADSTGKITIAFTSVVDNALVSGIELGDGSSIPTYTLTGNVYNDANQNGFQDTGENGYTGAAVTLDNGDSTTTDSNGNYSFSNLVAGSYTEHLTLPNGYSGTTQNPVNVAVTANTTQNFGIVQANYALNAGGAGVGTFLSDQNFTGGQTYSISDAVDTSGVTNPAPDAVYQTVRYGNFSYTISNLTPNSTHTVRLHFDEFYWNSAGSRVFNVSANGTQVLSNFDIYQAAGGKDKAVTEDVPATVDGNGNLVLQFSTVTDNAMVNGIELLN